MIGDSFGSLPPLAGTLVCLVWDADVRSIGGEGAMLLELVW
jgi:hypothetical protein